MDAYRYLALMAGCFLITLPLEWVLRARVYRRPRRLLLSLTPVLAVFVVWDLIAIQRGHWSYSERFLTGWSIGSLPVEELVFFVVVPVCGLITYEGVGTVLGWLRLLRQRWRPAAQVAPAPHASSEPPVAVGEVAP